MTTPHARIVELEQANSHLSKHNQELFRRVAHLLVELADTRRHFYYLLSGYLLTIAGFIIYLFFA